jgi:site-specific DNA-methyltransferase (cytosine-N4-specific)
MKKLLENPETYFAPKLRPSQHFVANTFRDNGGSLPSHLLTIPNSESGGGYLSACKAAGVSPHPARFPAGLPEFFIKLLTNPNDLVIDIFAGSNTTGMVAEKLGRRWATCDRDRNYVAASALRFLGPGDDPASIYRAVCNGEVLDLSAERHAPPISLAAGASSANPSSLQGHSRPAGTQLSPAEAHEREVAVAQGLPISVRANELDITSPHGSRRD